MQADVVKRWIVALAKKRKNLPVTDGSKLKRYAENNLREKPEQIRRTLFPRVVKAKRELEVDDEFKDDEVAVGHSRKTWLRLEIENVVKQFMGSSGKCLCDVDNEEIPKFCRAT